MVQLCGLVQCPGGLVWLSVTGIVGGTAIGLSGSVS